MKKSADKRIKNLLLHNFMAYHNKKIDIHELCKRLKRIDRYYTMQENQYKELIF